MSIMILGQGAIGSLLALGCEQQNISYSVLTRSGKTQSMYFPKTDISLTPTATNLSEMAIDDIIIVATKAYQVLPALHAIADHITVQPVVLLHNGMGVTEAIKQDFPRLPVFAATTRYGALKTNVGECLQTGTGQTDIGAIQNTTVTAQQQVLNAMSALLPPCHWQDNIEGMLWHKLAINCVINPLTVIHQCKNGILTDSTFHTQLRQICDEVAQVMGLAGQPMTGSALFSQVQQVCQATTNNYSSMNRDVANNRKTEIDHINGYLIDVAKQNGVTVPHNEWLYEQVKSHQIAP